MKIREIISLLSSNPLFGKGSSSQDSSKLKSYKLVDNDHFSASPKNLISISNETSEIYYYNPYTSKLYVIKVDSSYDTINSIKYQEIKIKINFEVYKIQLNDNSRYLSIVGTTNCIIVDLNPVFTSSYFNDDSLLSTCTELKTQEYQSITNCHYYSLDSYFQLSQLSLIIKQVEWHPLSNVHLVILYSNNLLKIYNVQKEEEQSEQTFNLESLHTWDTLLNTIGGVGSNGSNRKFNSFCFGPFINYWTRFSIFLMTVDGSIYVLCPIIPNNCLIDSKFYKDLQSNIVQKNEDQHHHQHSYFEYQFKWLMSVSALNNKNNSNSNNSINSGIEIDISDWIKLSLDTTTSPSSFSPLLQGPIYKLDKNTTGKPIQILSVSPSINSLSAESNHLIPFSIIILLNTGESVVTLSCQDIKPMWSTKNQSGIFVEKDDKPSFVNLIKYQILDLDLGKPKSFSTSNYLTFTNPSMKLDPLSDTILFYHTQGVHAVKFPWLNQIYKQMNQIEEQEQDSSNFNFKSTSLVSVLNSTPLGPQNDIYIPIVGLGVFSNAKIGNYLFIIPNTLNCILFDIDGLVSASANIKYEDEIDVIPQVDMVSPLKSLIENPPPFSLPRVALPPNISVGDSLEYILKAKANIFNLLSFTSQLDTNIKSRIKGLELLCKDQKNTSELIRESIKGIRSKQAAINSKLTALYDNQQQYSEQINILTQIENEGKPLSKYELEFYAELKSINQQINIYLEKINQFSSDSNLLQNNNKLSSSSKSLAISFENQKELQRILQDQDRRIIQNSNQLEKLFKSMSSLSINK
eukprot:gene3978-4976_t